LGVVVSNANITKSEATKISAVCHDAYARAIKPVHSSNDGDSIFCMAKGSVNAPVDLIAVLACEAMQQAIYRAVFEAKSAYGLQAART
jgi:L-aminopeptidase/D-esterase-like protein